MVRYLQIQGSTESHIAISTCLHCSVFSNTILATVIILNLITQKMLVLPLAEHFQGDFDLGQTLTWGEARREAIGGGHV